MAAAAEVRGMMGLAHCAPGITWTGDWWTCCGEAMECDLTTVAGRRDGEFWVLSGETVAVGRSGTWAEGCATEE